MSSFENDINITGTIVNYFLHCKRQCYLAYHKINMEDESELVRMGRVLHENKNSQELEVENIKIDKILGDYLIEIKKSDADVEASKFQILYYLKKLKEKGVLKKGKLEVIEKNRADKKAYIYELDEDNEKMLYEVLENIKVLVQSETVPPALKSAKCKKCAYHSYCSI